jgi:hypothetical protein
MKFVSSAASRVAVPSMLICTTNSADELLNIANVTQTNYPLLCINIKALITEHIYRNVPLTLLVHHHSNSSYGTLKLISRVTVKQSHQLQYT